jgi:hypothetical protein
MRRAKSKSIIVEWASACAVCACAPNLLSIFGEVARTELPEEEE